MHALGAWTGCMDLSSSLRCIDLSIAWQLFAEPLASTVDLDPAAWIWIRLHGAPGILVPVINWVIPTFVPAWLGVQLGGPCAVADNPLKAKSTTSLKVHGRRVKALERAVLSGGLGGALQPTWP